MTLGTIAVHPAASVVLLRPYNGERNRSVMTCETMDFMHIKRIGARVPLGK
jgi:hypothetical protein